MRKIELANPDTLYGVLSIHINAAGNGHSWMNAHGWCAYTTIGNTRTDSFATTLYESAQLRLPGMRLRTD